MAFGRKKSDTPTGRPSDADIQALADRIAQGDFPNLLTAYEMEQAAQRGFALITQGYVLDGINGKAGFNKTLEGALLLRFVGEGLVGLAGSIANELKSTGRVPSNA